MPYESIEDLPDTVKELPEKAQEIWMGAFNGAYERFKDLSPKDREGRSASVAWSQVRKAGYSGDIRKGIHIMEFRSVTLNDDGSAIFHDATLWSEGSWTNGGGGPPKTVWFDRKEIGKTSKLWEGIPIWMNHPTNYEHEHEPNDLIGVAKNVRMSGPDLIGDIHAHGKTQSSRDAIAMWSGNPPILPDLSPELTSKDIKTAEGLYATNIRPFGVAWVVKGACTSCQVMKSGEYGKCEGGCSECQSHLKNSSEALDDGAGDKGGVKAMSELEELQKKLDKAEETISEMKKSIEQSQKTEKDLKDMTSQADKDAETIKELKESIEKTDKRFKEMETLQSDLAEKVKEFGSKPDPKSGGYDGEDNPEPLEKRHFWNRNRGHLQVTPEV